MGIQAYEKLFKQIIRDRHKRDIDFQSIESRLEHLRGGEALKYDDLYIIGDDKCWPFSKYWMWPSREQIEAQLPKTKGWFKNLPTREEEVIRDLNAIFKNLHLVSIILRFIQPIHYAIYSRPPLKTMRVERGANDTAEYTNYIRVMRALGRSLGFLRTADVDTIVWAAAAEKADYLRKLKEILADKLPGRLSPAEIIALLGHDPLRMAQAHMEHGDHLAAGYFTSIAFERWLNSVCRRLWINESLGVENEIKSNIAGLCQTSEYRNHFDSLDSLRRLRNKAIHRSQEFTREDARKFIDGVKNFVKENRIKTSSQF
jgi:hypothetical protein